MRCAQFCKMGSDAVCPLSPVLTIRVRYATASSCLRPGVGWERSREDLTFRATVIGPFPPCFPRGASHLAGEALTEVQNA